MSGSEWPAFEQLADVPGFTVPVHRALTEPILLAGAPRAFAILNGTLAGAIGLGLQLWRSLKACRRSFGTQLMVLLPGASLLQ